MTDGYQVPSVPRAANPRIATFRALQVLFRCRVDSEHFRFHQGPPRSRMIWGFSAAKCVSVCDEYAVCPRSPNTPMRTPARRPTSGSVVKLHHCDLQGSHRGSQPIKAQCRRSSRA